MRQFFDSDFEDVLQNCAVFFLTTSRLKKTQTRHLQQENYAVFTVKLPVFRGFTVGSDANIQKGACRKIQVCGKGSR